MVIVGCFALTFCLHSFFGRALRRRSFIRQNSREPAPVIKSKDPVLGLDVLWESYSSVHSQKYLETSLARFEECGTTYEANLLGTRDINTIDPQNIRAILATQFKEFSLGTRRKNAFMPLLGSGIFTTDGDEWKRSRDLLKPAFAKSQLENVDLFETHFQDMLFYLDKEGKLIDLQSMFFKMTMDVATHLFFGESCGSLMASEQDSRSAERFDMAFNRTQRTTAIHFALGPVAALTPQKEFREDCEVVHAFVDDIVKRALDSLGKVESSHLEKPEVKGSTEYVVLEEALKLTQDPLELRGLLLSLIVAGRDTTASLLSNFWFVLARSPRIWEKLKAEVRSLKGEKPDFSTLKDLQYLQHCLKEALRLFPSIPFNTRTSEVDTTLPVGGGPAGSAPIFVPAGTPVCYNIWVMHRQKSIYGENVHEFVPERWEDIRPGWGYLPFNGGPRVCLGRKNALRLLGTEC